MRVVLISDVHGNAAALEAVLAACGPFDALWNLGDTVGYGPRPRECLARVRAEGADPMLVGNHDLAAIGALDLGTFNPTARAAAVWTGERLTAGERDDLSRLVPIGAAAGYTLAHGSPREPVWEYVLDESTATANFAHFATEVCFVGHTHVAMVATLDDATGRAGVARFGAGETVELGGPRRIINPGSVGQPRDRDPRAAFAMLDAARGTVVGHRVPYDVGVTQVQMAEAGLPASLAARLARGV